MKAILGRLLDRLDTIAEQHDEVGDTEVREAMSAAVFEGFLRPVPAFALPVWYAMYSDEGDKLVNQALAEYLSAANSRASDLGLASFHERLLAFQDGTVRSTSGSYYDDYFGWANPADYDATGTIVPRDDA